MKIVYGNFNRYHALLVTPSMGRAWGECRTLEFSDDVICGTNVQNLCFDIIRMKFVHFAYSCKGKDSLK